jgi:hypothetical protein
MTVTADPNAAGYPNPLDNFRTYSYHFIITAGSSTESLRSLIGKDDNNVSPLLARVHDVELGQRLNIDGSDAYLVLDTRRYSQYSVTDLTFNHFPGVGEPKNPMLLCKQGSMKIHDSTGLTFYNYLMDLFSDKLHASASSTFFLLTVMFSGHHYNGNVEHVVTCNIPFLISNLSFEFTSSGSVFDIAFINHEGVAAGNGLSSDQQLNMGDIRSATTKGRDKTVGGLIDSLEAQLNEQSLTYFLKYNGVSDSAVSNIKPGKLVQYMITVPPKWRALLPNLASVARNTEKKFPKRGFYKPVNKIVDDYEIAFSASTTIDKAISSILELSSEFLKESSSAKRIAGEGVQFRISPVITSDNSTYTIHFDVYPHVMPSPKNIIENKVNFITYDYLFTGKNTHIKDLRVEFDGRVAAVSLDKKLHIGRNRFAEIAASGQKVSTIKGDSQATDEKPSSTETDRTDIQANDPIFMGMKTKVQRINNSDHRDENIDSRASQEALGAKQEYNQTVAYLNYMSTLKLSMTVRGNPNIIMKLADANTTGGMPPHTTIISSTELTSLMKNVDVNNTGATQTAIKNGVASAKQRYIDTFVNKRIQNLDAVMKPHYNGTKYDPLLNGIDSTVLGLYAKINIRAPNVDYVGNFKDGASMFADEFFYKGIYRITDIDTHFANGEFYHVMHMITYGQGMKQP